MTAFGERILRPATLDAAGYRGDYASPRAG